MGRQLTSKSRIQVYFLLLWNMFYKIAAFYEKNLEFSRLFIFLILQQNEQVNALINNVPIPLLTFVTIFGPLNYYCVSIESWPSDDRMVNRPARFRQRTLFWLSWFKGSSTYRSKTCWFLRIAVRRTSFLISLWKKQTVMQDKSWLDQQQGSISGQT